MRAFSARLGTVDAVRGIAMVFVCLSHFAIAYLDHGGDHAVATRLEGIAMIASPTFVLLSGTMLGLIYARANGEFATRRRLFLERGFFLLTIGHLLLLLPSIPLGPLDSVMRPFVTDAIGVAMLLGTSIVTRTSGRQRLLLAVAIYLVSIVALFVWIPSGQALRLAKDVMVGLPPGGRGSYAFALLPWTSVYLVGTLFGEHVANGMARTGAIPSRHFVVAGAAAVALALVIRLGIPLLLPQAELTTPALDVNLRAFLVSPWQKYPPGPTYLLFFGGAGLLLMAGVFHLARLSLMRDWLLPPFEVIGRTSLATFVVQQYLYFAVLGHLGGRPDRAWPLLFLASLLLVWLAAHWWDRHRGNRWLSLTALARAVAFGRRLEARA
jgi:uncharacterized membrane protein